MISKKMKTKISSEALKKRLQKEKQNGVPITILLAQGVLFTSSLFIHQTSMYSKFDAKGIKTALIYQISALLLPYSKHLARLKCIRITCGFQVNTVADFVCYTLGFLFDKFYEKSLASLGVALSITVFVLLLLVITQPCTDLGILNFLVGVTGSVGYNVFGIFSFKYGVVCVISFVLFCSKRWLDHNWLNIEEDKVVAIVVTIAQEKKTISKSEMIEALIVPVFYLYWDQNLVRTDCDPDSIISCITSSEMVILGVCSSVAIVLRVYTMLRAKFMNKVKELEMPGEKIEVKIDDDDDDDESPDEIEVKVDDKSNEEIEVVLGTSEEVEDKVDDDEDMVIKSGRQEMDITLDTLRQRHNNPEEDRKRVANTTKESEGEGSEKTLKKSRSTFRIKSDSDTIDDGYKWRKYGKKHIKNSPYPRNYYKCSSEGCAVKKRVERDIDDPSYVVTTYEGIHNHQLSS